MLGRRSSFPHAWPKCLALTRQRMAKGQSHTRREIATSTLQAACITKQSDMNHSLPAGFRLTFYIGIGLRVFLPSQRSRLGSEKVAAQTVAGIAGMQCRKVL